MYAALGQLSGPSAGYDMNQEDFNALYSHLAQVKSQNNLMEMPTLSQLIANSFAKVPALAGTAVRKKKNNNKIYKVDN